MSSEKLVRLSKIYLDNNNPRHDPIDNEPEIIQYLIEKQSVKLLAKHISSMGKTNPMERIGVIPHERVKGAYVAAEGNRRTCALKLLADPDKAPKEADKKYFRRLRDSMDEPIEKLAVVVFDDADEARPWVSLRHEGEQGGVGTKPWNPEQQARFHAQKGGDSNPNLQSLRLIEYARKCGIVSAEQANEISLTTITRFLSSPVFRETIGLGDNKSLNITVPQEQFDAVVQKFLLDSLKKKDEKNLVHSRTSAKDRNKYANLLREENIAPVTRDQPQVDLLSEVDEKLDDMESGAGAKTQRKRNNKSPDERSKVVPSGFSCHIEDPVLKRLFDELRKIDPSTFSFSAAYLVRAVIERSCTIFIEKKYGSSPPELHKKIAKIVDALSEEGFTDRELKVWRVMASDKDSRYSPDSIGHFVHGGAIPTKTDAIKTWDSIESILKLVFERL